MTYQRNTFYATHLMFAGSGVFFLSFVILANYLHNKNHQPPQQRDYFASVPAGGRTGTALQSGDFDGDGDLDLIVGAVHYEQAKLYHFNNDGKGNFSQFFLVERPLGAEQR